MKTAVISIVVAASAVGVSMAQDFSQPTPAQILTSAKKEAGARVSAVALTNNAAGGDVTKGLCRPPEVYLRINNKSNRLGAVYTTYPAQRSTDDGNPICTRIEFVFDDVKVAPQTRELSWGGAVIGRGDKLDKNYRLAYETVSSIDDDGFDINSVSQINVYIEKL